jgi:hypothetical protein
VGYLFTNFAQHEGVTRAHITCRVSAMHVSNPVSTFGVAVKKLTRKAGGSEDEADNTDPSNFQHETNTPLTIFGGISIVQLATSPNLDARYIYMNISTVVRLKGTRKWKKQNKHVHHTQNTALMREGSFLESRQHRCSITCKQPPNLVPASLSESTDFNLSHIHGWTDSLMLYTPSCSFPNDEASLHFTVTCTMNKIT